MTEIDARTIPVDPESERRLRDRGYDYRVIDLNDDVAAIDLARATERGFLGPAPSDSDIAQMRETWATRRNIGVYPSGAPAGTYPAGTINSWVAEMTVPGGTVPMWAISMVTVDATHRRRGIARALLEGELRSAAAAGAPLAGLTVTEATIYGRYGFGPAIPVAKIEVDTRTCGWGAPSGDGRLEYVDNAQLARDLAEVHERARRQRAGQISGWPRRWLGLSGLGHDGKVKDGAVRGVRYVDSAGKVRGAMSFAVKELPVSFRHTLSIRQLVAETDDATRALWGFALSHDLVDHVDADLRPVDDPVLWMVANQRAVTVTPRDHGWLRILDVPAALEARRYSARFDGVLAVTDPYGFAEGAWRLQINRDGDATVTATEEPADITLPVAELSALYAGGAAPSTLATAGRIQGSRDAISSLGTALRVDPAPTLSIWY